MSMLRFNDGITINIDGPLRMLRLKDGLYVVGNGMSIPVEDRKEAKELIEEMTEMSKNK